MYWILQIEINLVCPQLNYLIQIFIYGKLRKTNVEFIKKKSSLIFS